MLNFVLTCAAVPIQLTHGSLWKIPSCILGGILKIFIFVCTYHENVKLLQNDVHSTFIKFGSKCNNFLGSTYMTSEIAHSAKRNVGKHFPWIKSLFSVQYFL